MEEHLETESLKVALHGYTPKTMTSIVPTALLSMNAEQLVKISMEWNRKIVERIPTTPVAVCQKHGTTLAYDIDRSLRATVKAGEIILIPARCPNCESADKEAAMIMKVRSWGVPLDYAEATFESFAARSFEEETHLDTSRRFVKQDVKVRTQFILSIGNPGTGKSFLSVAILRACGAGFYVTQEELLQGMRKRYDDKAAPDLVTKAKNTRCLVLDEIGLSTGGADEAPMLYSILAHRHANYMRTVLASNLVAPAFEKAMGERLMDRLRDSLFQAMTWTGTSRRGRR